MASSPRTRIVELVAMRPHYASQMGCGASRSASVVQSEQVRSKDGGVGDREFSKATTERTVRSSDEEKTEKSEKDKTKSANGEISNGEDSARIGWSVE